MKKDLKKSAFILLSLTPFLLSSCGKNVNREEVIEILDKIQKAIDASSFSLPTSFTESAVYTGDVNGSFYCSYDPSNYYYHEQTNYTVQQAPGKTTTTYDEYYYYVEDNALYYVNVVSKTYTKQTTFLLTDAKTVFSGEMFLKSDPNGYSISTLAEKVIKNGPSLVQGKLSSTSSGSGSSVSFADEKYLTLGDDSLDASFTRNETSSSSGETSDKYFYSFLKNRIQEMDETKKDSSSKLTFSWDNVKTTKPDFNALTSQASSSSSKD
jgi:hypothetical protein